MKARITYISKALGRAVDIVAVVPSPVYVDTLPFNKDKPDYRPSAKYPAIYLLHGVGNSCNNWFDYTQAELFAEENNIALISFSGENKFYVDNGDEKWQEFIGEELPAFVSGYLPVSDRAEDRFILGLSMGGYGAMLNYLKFPERYGAVGCLSGAVDKYEYANTDGGRQYNIHYLISENRKRKKPFAPVYVACGEEDFILDNSLHLKATLEENGVNFTWSTEKGYAHEWRFWNLQLEKFIKWLPRSDSYAGKTRKV